MKITDKILDRLADRLTDRIIERINDQTRKRAANVIINWRDNISASDIKEIAKRVEKARRIYGRTF